MYSVRYILRSGEHVVLRYIQLNLKKLNINHVMYVNFTTVARNEVKGNFFSDSLKIKTEAEFLTSSGTSFQS